MMNRPIETPFVTPRPRIGRPVVVMLPLGIPTLPVTVPLIPMAVVGVVFVARELASLEDLDVVVFVLEALAGVGDPSISTVCWPVCTAEARLVATVRGLVTVVGEPEEPVKAALLSLANRVVRSGVPLPPISVWAIVAPARAKIATPFIAMFTRSAAR